MKVLETERLIISHLTELDAPFFNRLLNSPSWIKYIGDRKVRTDEDAGNYIRDRIMPSYVLNGFGFYKVSLKDLTPIGICGLVKRDTLEDVDIGFAFLPEFEGKGYGYESAAEVLNLATSTIGLKRIVAITLKENASSIKLLEKLGLRYERMIQQHDEELMLMAMELENQ
ncbi:MAG: GNAT family N-acetyltransferase [Bacteroidota bacterium]|nr:GNAT family N-acetyltransferase [Bacteroidota bacterium]